MKRKPPLLDKPVNRHRLLLPEEMELWQSTLEEKSSVPRMLPAQKASVLPPPVKKKGASPAPLCHIEKKEKDKLKSGKMAIEATLDLHGLTREEAYEALLRFIDRIARRGVKAALVITGKGKEQGGTLRSLLPRWLDEPPLRGRIIAYDKAGSHHGGSGAWYVRIRKQK